MLALSTEQLNECFVSAANFLAVADELSHDLVGMVAGKMYPCVVNGAFACELLLKVIIGTSNSNGVPSSHRLRDLFSILPKAIQNSIITEYNKSSDLSLDSLLDETDNAFVEWRYAYEQNVRLHYIALIEFGKALKEVARKFI